METGHVVVEASPTLVGPGAVSTLELGRLASTAHKVIVHPSNTATLKATALHVCVCADLGAKGRKRKERGVKGKGDEKWKFDEK